MVGGSSLGSSRAWVGGGGSQPRAREGRREEPSREGRRLDGKW